MYNQGVSTRIKACDFQVDQYEDADVMKDPVPYVNKLQKNQGLALDYWVE